MSSIIEDMFQVQQFIYREQRCIDERRWEDWLALFSDDAEYWIPLDSREQTPGQALSIVYENKTGMELRCRRYAHPLLHAQNPPSRTSHMISNLIIDSVDHETDSYVAKAQFSMNEFRLNKEKTWSGSMSYHLKRLAEQDFKIDRKKVELIDAEGEIETINVLF